MEVFIALLFAVGVTLPNILLLGLGRWLRRTGKVDEAFCQKASQVVFQWSLPMLLLSNIIGKPVHFAAQGRLVLAGLLTTFLLYALAEAFAHFHIPQPADKGVFVQGVFRSNLGIIGLAFVQNAYGGDGLANSAVYMGIITIELNILAVLTLSRTKQASWRQKLADTARKIATNPLIAAIVLAMCLNELPWSMPESLLQTARYLGHLALPLALLCAGAVSLADGEKMVGRVGAVQHRAAGGGAADGRAGGQMLRLAGHGHGHFVFDDGHTRRRGQLCDGEGDGRQRCGRRQHYGHYHRGRDAVGRIGHDGAAAAGLDVARRYSAKKAACTFVFSVQAAFSRVLTRTTLGFAARGI